MSQSCGSIEFIDGGTIRNATIINTQISGSVVTGCVLDGCEITNLKSIDTTSLKVIAQALVANIEPLPQGGPVVTEDSFMSNIVLGDRNQLLGRPQFFAKFGDFIIPVYQSSV